MSESKGDWKELAVTVLLVVLSGMAGAFVASADRRVPPAEPHPAVRAACGWCGRQCPYCRAAYPGQLGDVKK